MKNISLKLSGRLDPIKEQVFREIADAAATLDIPFFLVGACARDIWLELIYDLPVQRATNDIDFGIWVESWNGFDSLKKRLITERGYSQAAYQPQRLRSREGILVDIVPFGGIEDPQTRSIKWPPDDSIVMSTIGFEEAYRHSPIISFAADLELRVSSLVGLSLMKIIAWNDRHQTKDAKDLKYILSSYLQAGNRERLELKENLDLLEEERFISVELTGARLLGRDLALLLTAQSRSVVLSLLENPASLASAMSSDAVEIDEAFESALSLLEMLKQGIIDRPSDS